MDGFVYVLISRKDHKRYIGSTTGLSRRLSDHNSGLVKFTKNRRPLDLYAYQKCDSIKEARCIEKLYKRSRGTFDRAIINKELIISGSGAVR